jgi:type I restriction enzyme R subunit
MKASITFTVIDFVNAYHMFYDPEWDGEPRWRDYWILELRAGGVVSRRARPKKIKIKLSDGKVREIQSMSSTMFYLDGKPVSAEEFIKKLFDTLSFLNSWKRR